MSSNRSEIIKGRLTILNPTYLDIIDDSAMHAGHAGSQNGAGHYTIKISSEIFQGKSLVECHRMIYDTLKDLIPHEIHAISIKVVA